MTGGRALVRFELAAATRGWTAILFAAGFAAASVGVALAGLAAGGTVTVQGFARTSLSLLQLVVWVVPLLGLLLGAVAGAECQDLEFLAALPLPRHRLVLARWAAWYVVLGGALLVGFGAAGIVIGSLAGAADAARYLALVGVAQLLLGASLAVGLYVGVRSRSRARAVGIAVVLWAVLTIGVDLVAIAALAILPAQPSGWALSLVLVGDPVDSARVLGLGLFRADVIAGPTGAALRQVLGGFGPWVLLAGLATWTIAPLIQAGRRFARSDL